MEEDKELETQVEELRRELKESKEKSSNPNLIPGAIIISGIIIAGALFYGGGGIQKPTGSGTDVAKTGGINIKAVTSSDHILGSLDAPVKIVEFSDLECPFCKSFHPTIKQVYEEYGKDGKVAWVYRHFPLDSIHPKARKEAEASECAAELGGNSAFWAYVDRLFEVTPSNNRLESSQLPEIAAYIGLNKDSFKQCLDSGKHASKVEAQLKDAIDSGGQGTPYSVVIAKNGKNFPISGALPYERVKPIIEAALQEK